MKNEQSLQENEYQIPFRYKPKIDRDLPEFMSTAARLLQPKGRLEITVPHTNQSVGKKRFQHFDSTSLTNLLSPKFSAIKFWPFNFSSRLLGLWFRYLGRSGDYFLVTLPPLLNKIYEYYAQKCLFESSERKGHRISCVATSKK